MTYKVVVTPTAQRHLIEAFKYIAGRSPLNAERWFNRIQDAIASRGLMPKRCPLAPETEYLDVELRHLIHKPYRIIFSIRGRTVRVLYVRHGARRAIGEAELDDDD